MMTISARKTKKTRKPFATMTTPVRMSGCISLRQMHHAIHRIGKLITAMETLREPSAERLVRFPRLEDPLLWR